MKEKIKRLAVRIFQNRFYYILIIPAVVLLFIFAYQPMYGVILAFKKYSFRKGIWGSPWIGFDNFATIFAEEQFWISFRNTLIINLLKLITGFPAPIILAVMINAIHKKFLRSSVQTILYLPHFLSWIVISSMIFALLDNDGAIYKLLTLLGMKNVNVLSDGNVVLGLIVLSDLWKEAGWGAIIYLAALSGINPELYEAADLDGANTLRKFRHITIPGILPTISIMLILRVGGLVGGNFEQVYSIYNELVYDKVDIIDTFLYRYGINQGRFAEGTAIGLFTNVINIVLLLIANFSVKLLGGEGLY